MSIEGRDEKTTKLFKLQVLKNALFSPNSKEVVNLRINVFQNSWEVLHPYTNKNDFIIKQVFSTELDLLEPSK